MSLLQNEKLLNEEHKVDDRFDFTFVTNKLEHLVNIAPDKALICLIGPYGSGKSTALHQIQMKKKKQKNSLWFEFDAWRYPERKELWENFVLELAREFDNKTFEAFEKKLDGRSNADKAALLGVLAKGANILVPGAGIIGNLNHFLATSPATRTYQIQKILTELIENNLKNKLLFIVAEDIDRSGEAGIFFLETLKTYIKTLPDHIKIKCIIPVAEEKYDVDTYLKCADIIEYFRPPRPSLFSYIDKVLSNEYFDELSKKQISSFCEDLFAYYQDQMSPRKLKHILRLGNTKYESMRADGLLPDGRVAIAIEASKLLNDRSGGGKLYKYFLTRGGLSESPYIKLFNSIVFQSDYTDERVTESRINYSIDSSIREPLGKGLKCIPWHINNEAGGHPQIQGYLQGFYFDY
jgi:hypothetical protein